MTAQSGAVGQPTMRFNMDMWDASIDKQLQFDERIWIISNAVVFFVKVKMLVKYIWSLIVKYCLESVQE